MINALKGSLLAVVAFGLFNACSSSRKAAGSEPGTKGLKDYYKDYFPVGVAVAPRMLHGEDSALIVSQFNSLTAENAMKMGPLHPREN
ncbi:MAG TPA: endo-1,4-beta-xylanase, partial [Flavisolibacter sp.]|nr:endo-1,4-beta-xylanase [Flavisolibacter sp.]